MAFRNTSSNHGSWFQEQVNMINSATEEELNELNDGFDTRFAEAATAIKQKFNGVNVIKDWKKMMENPTIMQEYKTELLEPICNEFRNYPTTDEAERYHLEQVAKGLENAWDEGVKSFLIQESYNVANYLPLSTLDFPALIKQYIRFLGKDLIPVQTANSTNIEQRIFTKYLVNNNTGEEWEVPAVYFKKDEDGNPLWKKIFNAGKGLRIYDKEALLLSTIQAAPNKKYSLFQWLMDDNGDPLDGQGTHGTFTPTMRSRISYDLNIRFVQVTQALTEDRYDVLNAQPADWATAYTSYFTKNDDGTYTAVPAGSGTAPTFAAGTYYKKTAAGSDYDFAVKLPAGGLAIDIQHGGIIYNGAITEDMVLPVVDPETKRPTGETISFSDRVSGAVDFVKGTITLTSCGVITGVYIDGFISNEDNLRTIGFREYPEIRNWLIADGCRFQLPFTVEDFAEANASLNFNLYSRLVQELVTQQELIEDSYIVDFLERDFDANNGYDADAFKLESYTHVEYADLSPTALSPNFAGDPYEYRTNAVHNAIESVIYELCDKGKYDNLGFVIYCNPKAARLLNKFTTWTVQKSTEIGGVQMNHAFGVLTDSSTPIRVVASNRVDAYIIAEVEPGTMSREYFYNIIAYPMDKFHITYKHLRFARHLTNSPENAAYTDGNAGGAAMYVTSSAQYRTIVLQGIQGRVICKNTVLVPDSKAGPIQ